MSERRRAVCPQCGGYRIKHRWVKRTKEPKFADISFDEYAEDLKKQVAWVTAVAGDIHLPSLKDYSQLVLECEDCGYTEVFNIERENVERQD